MPSLPLAAVQLHTVQWLTGSPDPLKCAGTGSSTTLQNCLLNAFLLPVLSARSHHLNESRKLCIVHARDGHEHEISGHNIAAELAWGGDVHGH